jgi:ectoine hydroxylase-related dioxygenase (phytanoyl-CoA dioxygenase family)
MAKTLTADQVTRYAKDGFVFPLRVFTPEEAAGYCAACGDLETRLGGKPRAVELSQTHRHFQWAYDMATDSRVLDAVQDVLGPNVLLWSTSIFAKHPRDPAYISWHQDGTYWGLDSTQVTTAWIALSDSTVENGCMRVVAGSHRQEILPHNDTYADRNLLSRGQEIEVEVNEQDATDIVLQPGEMSLHHVRIIHGSNPNRSDVKRVGFAIRYITPEVQQEADHSTAILARGQDDYNHYELVGAPPERGMEEALAAHRETARKHIESLIESRSEA